MSKAISGYPVSLLIRILIACAVALTAASPAFALDSLIISEFRERGDDGAEDEFVEIYNNSGADHTVTTTDGSSGYAVVGSNGVTRFFIPSGTVIPNRGHYLGANSDGYSLTSTAAPDRTYTNNLGDNEGLALFKTSNPSNFTLANRLDAVGPASESNPLYKEGTGYPDLNISSSNWSIARKLACSEVTFLAPSLPNGTVGVSYSSNVLPIDSGNGGKPVDTGNNETDFRILSLEGINLCSATASFECQRLGSPNPENLGSTINRGPFMLVSLADPAVSATAAPNYVRDHTPGSPSNSSFGTISIRRKLTNNTGADLTRLRLRVVDISTYPAGGGPDYRVLTSGSVVIATSGGIVTASGLNVDAPTYSAGHGLMSRLLSTIVTNATPISNGTSMTINILLGVETDGDGEFVFIVEALP